MFFIDKSPAEMTKEEQQRLNMRAQRFASDSNKGFRKKLSVADLVQAVVRGCGHWMCVAVGVACVSGPLPECQLCEG